MSVVRRHPLITFFVLTYVLTWAPLLFGIFFTPGPLLAALIVIPLTQGRVGLRELGSRIIRWRVRWYWYAVAIGLPLAIHLLTVGINVALGAGAPSLERVMNLAEKPHPDADSAVSSVHHRSLVFRIRKPFLSKFITASSGNLTLRSGTRRVYALRVAGRRYG